MVFLHFLTWSIGHIDNAEPEFLLWYGQEKIAGLELRLEILDIDSLRVVGTGRVLERLVLFHKSDWKVIDLIAQSIIRLY